jgi:hypothetical protein
MHFSRVCVFFFLLSPLLIPLAFARLLGFVPHGLNSLFYTYSTQVVNYFFVITLTPPAIIIHHKYFGGFGPEGWCYINKYLCYRCAGSKVMNSRQIEVKPAASANKDNGENKNDGEIEMQSSDFKPSRLPGSAEAEATPQREDQIALPYEDNSIEVRSDTDLLSKILIRAFETEAPESWGKLKVNELKYHTILHLSLCLSASS